MSRKVKAVIGGIEIPMDDEEVKLKNDSGEADKLGSKVNQTLYINGTCILFYATERGLHMFFIEQREEIDKIAVYSGIGDYYEDVKMYDSVMDFIEDKIPYFSISNCVIFEQVD